MHIEQTFDLCGIKKDHLRVAKQFYIVKAIQSIFRTKIISYITFDVYTVYTVHKPLRHQRGPPQGSRTSSHRASSQRRRHPTHSKRSSDFRARSGCRRAPPGWTTPRGVSYHCGRIGGVAERERRRKTRSESASCAFHHCRPIRRNCNSRRSSTGERRWATAWRRSRGTLEGRAEQCAQKTRTQSLRSRSRWSRRKRTQRRRSSGLASVRCRLDLRPRRRRMVGWTSRTHGRSARQTPEMFHRNWAFTKCQRYKCSYQKFIRCSCFFYYVRRQVRQDKFIGWICCRCSIG